MNRIKQGILMKTSIVTLIAFTFIVGAGHSFAADVTKANNTTGWNNNSAWSGNVQPAPGDRVIYDSTVTTFNSVSTGSNFSLGQLQIKNPGGLVTIRDNTITLTGIDGIGLDMSTATQDLTFNTTVNTSTAQQWYLGNRTVTFLKAPTNFFTNVTIADSGNLATNQNITLSSAFAYTGTWTQLGGTFTLNSTGTFSLTELNSAGGTIVIGDTTAKTNLVNPLANLRLGGAGAGTIIITNAGSGANQQTFANLNNDLGMNTVNSSSTGLLTITNGYNRTKGGMINFTNAAGVVFTNTPIGTGVYGSGANTLLIGAVLNNNDFIQAISGTLTPVTYTDNTLGTGLNSNMTGNYTTVGDVSTQSLRFTANQTLTLGGKTVVESGGILVPNASVTITGGTLTAGVGQSLWLHTANGTQTISSVIADNGSPLTLEKYGNGALTLSGSNTFTGEIIFSGGAININSLNALGNGNAAIRNSGAGVDPTLNINVNNFTTNRSTVITKTGLSFKINTNANNATFNGDITYLDGPNNMNFIKQGSGTLTLGGRTMGMPRINVNQGTLINTGTIGDGTTNSSFNIDGNGALTVDNGQILRNGGSLTSETGSNKVFNVTIQNQGRIVDNSALTMGNSGSFGGFNLAIKNTGLYQVNNNLTVNTGTNNSTSISLANSGSLIVQNDILFQGGIDVVSGTMTINMSDTSRLQSTAGSIKFSDNKNYSNALTTVNQSGGTVEAINVFVNDTNKTGLTTNYNLNGGVLRTGQLILGNNSTLYANSGTFQARGGITTITGTSNGQIILQQGGLTVDTNGNTLNENIALQHDSTGVAKDGGLTKIGNGTLLLAAANSYTGDTIVSAGTLQTGALGTFGAGNVSIADGATLTLGNNVSINNLSTLSFGHGSTINLNFSGTETIGSLFDLTAGSLISNLTVGQSYNAATLNSLLGVTTFNGTGSLIITSIPEPSTWVLLAFGAGLLGTVGFMRRRRA
jgi:autotransporter-associated beta strand protein